MERKNEEVNSSCGYQSSEWIGYGVAIGVALGLAFDNLAMGIALGIAIGAGMSSYNNSDT